MIWPRSAVAIVFSHLRVKLRPAKAKADPPKVERVVLNALPPLPQGSRITYGRCDGVGRCRGDGRDRGVTLGVALGVALAVAVGVTEGVPVGLGVAVGVPLGVGVGGGVAEGVTIGVPLGPTNR
jgi:hypothetical protein